MWTFLPAHLALFQQSEIRAFKNMKRRKFSIKSNIEWAKCSRLQFRWSSTPQKVILNSKSSLKISPFPYFQAPIKFGKIEKFMLKNMILMRTPCAPCQPPSQQQPIVGKYKKKCFRLVHNITLMVENLIVGSSALAQYCGLFHSILLIS